MVMTMGVVLQMTDSIIYAMWGSIVILLTAINLGVWMKR